MPLSNELELCDTFKLIFHTFYLKDQWNLISSRSFHKYMHTHAFLLHKNFTKENQFQKCCTFNNTSIFFIMFNWIPRISWCLFNIVVVVVFLSNMQTCSSVQQICSKTFFMYACQKRLFWKHDRHSTAPSRKNGFFLIFGEWLKRLL